MERRWRGAIRPGLVVGLAILLGACGEIAIPGIDGGATPVPAQPTAVAKSGPTAVVSASQLPAGFPSDFPLPPQYQLQTVTDDGRQIAVVLMVPSAQAAYDFYKSALPRAGYQMQDLGGTTAAGAFSGGLTVSGKGISGEIAITAVGPSPLVSIRLERGGAAQPAPAATAGQAGLPIKPPQLPPTPPAQPATPAAASQPGAATGGLPAGFPEGFPLPPRYQVQSATDDGRQLAIVLNVQSAQAAYDYYKGALPLAGYQVREEGAPRTGGGLFTGGLSFSGQGQSGRIAFSAAGPTNLVTISLERSGATAGTGAPPATPPAAAPSPAATPGSSTAPAGLPANFPLPAQAQVQATTGDGQQVAVVIGVPSAKEAFAFYQGALPGAGYQIVEQNGVDGPGGVFGGLIKITGNGVSGELAFAASPAGQTVAIRLARAGGTPPAGGQPTPAAKPGAGGGAPVAGLPPGFPLPPEHRVQNTADNGRQVAVILIVPSVQVAYDFFKGALPGAGYQVTERGVTTTPGGAFNGVLSIRGHGVSGEVVCTSASGANLVAISLNRTP